MTAESTPSTDPLPAWSPKGQRVLVTGASSGIGEAVALQLAEAGATVGICARREDRLAAVLDRCRERSPESRMWVVDLSDMEQVDRLVAEAPEGLGGVDVLINNAGVPKRRAATALTFDDVESTMRINYFSPVRLTLGLLPAMVERGSGHVCNVSSMGAHMVAWRTGASSATKAALELFTENLYLDLVGTGVQAHLFVPGSTRSEFSTPKEGNDPPFTPDQSASAPAEDVAAALIASLSTDEFMTFASEKEATTAATKAADVNGFLARMRTQLSGRG
jgi:short-subunit dehydrogenase